MTRVKWCDVKGDYLVFADTDDDLMFFQFECNDWYVELSMLLNGLEILNAKR